MRKLTKIEHVNEQRARRLLQKFGTYDAVMNASYQQLVNTYYIGEVTAKSIHRTKNSDPGNLL
jgi:excinuclease UvrABC nuclease subunit